MNPLTNRILQSPCMWPAAAKVKFARAIGKQDVTVRRAGLSITCGTGDGQGSFCAIAGPEYEPELLWLLTTIQPGDTFVDVGANIGIYSLHAARCLKGSGAVFSFEPSPDAVRMLMKNNEQNGFEKIITPIHAAASRTSGQLFLAGSPTKWNSLQLHDHPPGIPIEVKTVDQVLSDETRRAKFHFMKIDAEGVETDVLEGARDLIDRMWPKIIFENSINRSNELPTDWLLQRGYSIHAVDLRGHLVSVPFSEYERHTNLVAVHPNSRKNAREIAIK